MIRFGFVIALFSLITACTSSYPLKSVDYSDLFCDGNSKVWVINKMIVNKTNIAPHNIGAKELFIFHSSGTINYLPMKALGSVKPEKGRYYLDSDEREMYITFDKKEWIFDLPVLEENRIIMRPKKEGKAPFSLELIPLPEL